MSLLRFLGIGGGRPGAAEEGETETVRRIASQLERLDPPVAKFLAAFAYVLARVAHVDLDIDDDETREMERSVHDIAELSEGEAALVVQIAKSQARLLGGTENYVVTREFRNVSSKEQRARLLQCLYAVAAADGTISGEETNEIAAIGHELGFTRPEINSIRAEYRDKIGALRG